MPRNGIIKRPGKLARVNANPAPRRANPAKALRAGPTKTVSIPTQRERASCFLGPVYYFDDEPIIYDLSVATFVNMRLGRLAQLYDNWKFNSATLDFVPALGATAPGTVTLAFEPDACEDHASSEDIEIISQQADNMSGSLVGSLTMPIKTIVKRELYTSIAPSNMRQCCPGKVIALATGSDETWGTVVGYLRLSYDVLFSKPSVSETGLVAYNTIHTMTAVGDVRQPSGAVSESAMEVNTNAAMTPGTTYTARIWRPSTTGIGVAHGNGASASRYLAQGSRIFWQQALATIDDAADTWTETGVSSTVVGRVLGMGARLLSWYASNADTLSLLYAAYLAV